MFWMDHNAITTPVAAHAEFEKRHRQAVGWNPEQNLTGGSDRTTLISLEEGRGRRRRHRPIAICL